MRSTLVAAAALSLLTVGLVPGPVRADDAGSTPNDASGSPSDFADGECVSVRDPIVTTFFVDGCMSPFGLCTEGIIPSGPLAGTTQFSVLSLAPGDLPELLDYTGVLVITAADGSGTLTIQDYGVLNQLDGSFFEIEQAVNGSGSLANHAGTLFAQGTSTATGFEGTLSGLICSLSRDNHDHDN